MVMTPRPMDTSIKNPPSLKATDREQQEVSKLRAILETEQARPTVMTAAEFKKYAVLFQKPKENMSMGEAAAFDEKVNTLTASYLRRIDMYKEVHVVDLQGNVILRIPPLFVQLSSLSPTQANDEAVLVNRKFSRSDIPRFRDQALAKLNEALIAQQMTPEQKERVGKVTQQTHALLDDFFSKKLGIAKPDTKPEQSVVDTPTEPTATVSTGKCLDL